MARKLVVEIVGDASSLEKSYATATRSTKVFGREISHATRGTISGTNAMKGFGRSLAFASGGFLAFQGVSKFLTDSIVAARDAAVAHRSLAAQMKAAGESFAANRDQVEKASLSYERFGFQNDEVIASLTVLERGTGNINKAIRLQGLTADIARAKNIDLAAAANTVAKVFGGQETALRRAVPGLAKHAHGWDLIRLAQAKMAGQAAANTTASEQFAATLHDTEEIIGTGLLPILNKYLGSLGQWLRRMNESGKLQRDINEVTGALATAIGILKGAFDALNTITGSTKHSLELLFRVFIGFKALQFASSLKLIATNIGLIGANAARATPRVEAFGGATAAGGAAAGAGAGAAAGRAARGGGGAGLLGRIPELGALLFGGVSNQASLGAIGIKDGVQKIGSKWYLVQDGKVVAGPSDRDPRLPKLGAAGVVASTSGADTPGPHNVPAAVAAALRVVTRQQQVPTGPTAAQRNTWFDALISRDLFRAGLEPLRQQLASLGQVAALLTKRIAITKDITRKLNLEDQLLQVNADRAAIRAQLRQQVIDQLKAQAEQARAAREAARAAREAAQFRALGLGPGGEPLTPGVRGLKRQLAAVADAVKGTFLDTAHVRSLLAHIRRVLSGGLGAVGKDVRARINQMLNDLQSQLKQRTGDQTRFRHVSTEAILAAAGLNLTPAQARRLAAALSVVGPGGSIPAHSSGQFAGAGAVNVYGDVHMHGVQDPKGMEHHLTKRGRQRAHVRRGAR